MTKAPDANLEPIIDNLWYYDSVVSSKSPTSSMPAKAPSSPPDELDPESSSNSLASFSESQLPLSTGGESSIPAQLVEDERCAAVNPSRTKGEGRPELSTQDLCHWMKKLGLEYTEDGMMIRIVPNSDSCSSSRQRLDFAEFVCLKRFIEEQTTPACKSGQDQLHHSEGQLASLYEVFRLFDEDDNGLVSVSELRVALAKLGLRQT